jgi:hypothetical protein
MARKSTELRPIMTRIPEGLRKRLEREAKWRRRSMNAEIITRLQESFDIPDQAYDIASDVSSEVSSDIDAMGVAIQKSLDGIRDDIRTVLARLEGAGLLGPSQPKDDGEGQETGVKEGVRRAEQQARTDAALERAVQTIERAGFKIARVPKPTDSQDDGESK